MKTTLRNIAISAAIATMMSVSVVHAESAPAEDMKMAEEFMATAQAFVQSAVGADGNVLVTIDGDVATLVGVVNNLSTKMKAEQAALKDSRVNKVQNHVVSSN